MRRESGGDRAIGPTEPGVCAIRGMRPSRQVREAPTQLSNPRGQPGNSWSRGRCDSPSRFPIGAETDVPQLQGALADPSLGTALERKELPGGLRFTAPQAQLPSGNW